MLRAGNKVDIAYMWSTAGRVNDPFNNKHSWNLYNLTRGGNFRSSLIDFWNTDPPEEISINFCNTQGDVLWWIKFNSSRSNTPSSWMIPEKIVNSSSDIHGSLVSWQTHKLKYQTYLSSIFDENRAWFAVWNGEVYTMDYPVFLFSNDPEHPQPLLETDFEHIGKDDADYRGCWPGYSLERFLRKEDMAGMTVDMCNRECISAGKPFILLEKRYRCWCGKFASNPRNRVDALCEASCPGNPIQICGNNGDMHAVFPIQQVPVPDVPMSSVLWKTLDLGHWRKEYMIELTAFLSGFKFPAFLTAVAVSLNDDTYQPFFTLYYNHLDCNSANKKPYMDQDNIVKIFKADGVKAVFEVIHVRCLWIIFEASDSNSITPGVQIRIYRPNDPYFVSAPALVIKGHWKEEQVSTETMTTESTTSYSDLTRHKIDETSNNKLTTSTSKTSTVTDSSYISTAETLFVTTLKLPSEYKTSEIMSTEEARTHLTEQSETPTTVKTLKVTQTTDRASVKTYPTSVETSTVDRTSVKTYPALEETSTVDWTSVKTYPTSEETSTADRTSLKTYSSSVETSTVDRTSVKTSSTNHNTEKAIQSTMPNKTLNNSRENTSSETGLCKCICFSKTILINNSHELKEHIEELQKNLTVNKTQLSSHIRKLKSASDNRVSAQRIGYVGATFLSLIAGFILFIDLIDVVRIINKKTSKKKAFGRLK